MASVLTCSCLSITKIPFPKCNIRITDASKINLRIYASICHVNCEIHIRDIKNLNLVSSRIRTAVIIDVIVYYSIWS